jgi:uncharacterized protein YbjQ (UPF0145 family)
MTTCPKCGYTRQQTDITPDYECPKCKIIYSKFDPVAERQKIEQAEAKRLEEERKAAAAAEIETRRLEKKQEAAEATRRFNAICITTTNNVPCREVDSVIEVITAECAFGMNVFKDFFASMSDFFGGRSNATQNVLRDARREVLKELRKEAYSIGAEAVIGVDLDYSEFSGGGKSMLFLVASGTAVKLKPKED